MSECPICGGDNSHYPHPICPLEMSEKNAEDDVGRYWRECREMIAWLREQGATAVKVGDISASFAQPAPKSAEELKTVIGERTPVPLDKAKNPLGGDLGVTDDILLRSV